ncbi:MULTISPECIES: MauE/DoxX family redox-associated membrane protein [Pseudoalteromonas]|uniref:MauE/DoxX family redox-associated membrane protein n=1 Tax=Pseudoalteromonas TaxID=53246 RepID=UPI0026E412C2|nr:MauE/DoxX family redox-associated membrane protein [Pseudoalteromonas carrageenovora]MDO6462939.1 glutaredoxin family protein [Pseudoalteromonas carrageenovora]MDO6547198.1 glutaredoxin family protein [Pseudoalteromonas carrageenovora]MDO6635381.1 glutaredoxin family protein [Pseudoalteromonas carrageenovora]MDO6647462.1 glutaredoxin family protein [Pseudoalteromonas carrageenovora]MDO6831646.1 glutaredoxin family protein [Pseudoalteromonas carrageenovora]
MAKSATLYRMATDEHICPFGLKSKDLLKRKGYELDDNLLTSREETDAFKNKHDVKTTPQTFIDNERIGGYDELRSYFNKSEAGQQGTTYTPVLAIFAVTLLMAFAFSYASNFALLSSNTAELFVALTMGVLAIQKLRDLFSFTNSFITYDLLAMKVVRYAYVYPFLEAFVSIGMIAALPAYTVAPISLFIGGVGAVSVIKAVYIDKRELKCACVGGDSNVPLGFVSLTENLFMIGAGVWMFIK